MLKIQKNTVETLKTVVISVLVSAIIAFIGGMSYANQIANDKASAVNEAKTAVTVNSAEAKK